MAQPQRKLSTSGLKKSYWLFLPIVGFGIWMVTGWMTGWVLSNSFGSERQLQTSLYPTTQLTRTLIVTSIDARIDRDDNITEVTLTTTNSSLERLEFKLPIVTPVDLEKALAKELNVMPASIQTLIQYQ